MGAPRGLVALKLSRILLELRVVWPRCLKQMHSASSPETKAGAVPSWLVGLLKRALRLVIMGVVLTLFYTWAVPRFHPRQGAAGFGYGVLHGAIMPMALPALLAGRDVTIYAEQNTGRTYKLGYTIGINVCGLVVFGTAFWTPGRKPQEGSERTLSQVPDAAES
jgi:hypothetical protein